MARPLTPEEERRVERGEGCPYADEAYGRRITCLPCPFVLMGERCVAREVMEGKLPLDKVDALTAKAKEWGEKPPDDYEKVRTRAETFEKRRFSTVMHTFFRKAGYSIEKTSGMLGIARDTARKRIVEFAEILGLRNPKQLLDRQIKGSAERGLSDKDISNVTGVPEGTIKGRRIALGLLRKRGRHKKDQNN